MVDGRSTQIPNPQFRTNVASSLRPRVKLPVHGFEPLLVNVGVNLRRRNIGVAQHGLHASQIGSPF